MRLNRVRSRASAHPLVTRLVLAGFLAALLAFSQREPGMAERYKQMSADFERKGLAEPFVGITTAGKVEPGLFTLRSTGVSTEPVRKAAEMFLTALTSEQRAKTMFPVDDPEWRKWMNQHFYVRQGVSFKEMTDGQREAAFGLMRASLSAKGMKLTRDIMHLNETLAELTNDFEFLGEWMYNITVMGKPSAKDPWGWQFDGHHAIINYFVLGDQVVMTPYFAGSEPVIATSGKYKGTVILQDEQDKGFAMLKTLTDAQRKKAVLSFSKTGNNNLTEAFKDNVVLDYAGMRVSDLSAAQRNQLVDLIAIYAGNMVADTAYLKMYAHHLQYKHTSHPSTRPHPPHYP